MQETAEEGLKHSKWAGGKTKVVVSGSQAERGEGRHQADLPALGHSWVLETREGTAATCPAAPQFWQRDPHACIAGPSLRAS